jgi:hypothetical protein
MCQQPAGEAAGLQIAAAGALTKQFDDTVAGGLGVGGQRGEVAAVAARSVECGEDVCQLVCELAAEASGGAAALAEGDEVPQDVGVIPTSG